MAQTQLLADIGKWAAIVTFYVTALFPLIGVVWPWWQSWWGRNIVLLEIALALTLLKFWVTRTFGTDVAHSLWFTWVSTVALCTVPVIVTWRGGMIVAQQVSAARREMAERKTRSGVPDAAGR